MKKVVRNAIVVATQSANKMTSKSKTKIALTLGDPSGIGPEVIVKALSKISAQSRELPLIIGDTKTVIEALEQINYKFPIKSIQNISSLDNESDQLFILDNVKIPWFIVISHLYYILYLFIRTNMLRLPTLMFWCFPPTRNICISKKYFKSNE